MLSIHRIGCRGFVGLFLGLAIGSLPSGASAQSLENGGFETGTQEKWLGGGQVYGVSKEAAHTGNFGAYNNGKWNSIYRNINDLSPHTTYTLTVWARLAASAIGNNHRLYISQDDGKTQTAQPVTGTEWKQYKFVFTTGNNTVVRAGEEEFNGSSDIAYIDDMAISRGGDAAGGQPPVAAAQPSVSAATRLAAPADLVATPGDGQVRLSWAAVPGATGYNIKQSTTPGSGHKVIAKGVAARAVSIQKLTNGATYYYVVSAVGGNGESVDSTEVSATPQLKR